MTSPDDPITELREILRRQVAAFEVRAGQDLVRFLPMAGLLSALGDNGAMNRWPALAGAVGGDLTALLRDRAHEGRWDIEHSSGEPLAHALLEAQEWSLFLERARAILPREALLALDDWIETAGEVVLDIDCLEHIEASRELACIPEDERLPNLDPPLGEDEMLSIVLRAPELRVVQATWEHVASRLKFPEIERSPALLAADAGPPKDHELRRYHVKWRGNVPDVGTVDVSAALDEDWKFIVGVRTAPGRLAAQRVRLGTIPAAARHEGAFVVDLAVIPSPSRRRELLESALCVIDFGAGLQLALGWIET